MERITGKNTAGFTRRGFIGLMATAGATIALSGCAGSISSASQDMTADLIVVGGGAGGMAAAAKAAQGGASVILLEARANTGGTTALSGGHYKYIDDDFMKKLPARTADSDAELQKYLAYDAKDFGDYGATLTTLQKQITEYLASSNTLEFDSIEYWLILHYVYTQGTDLNGNKAETDFSVVSPAYYNQAEVHSWMVDGGITFSDPQPDNRGAGGPLSVEPTGQGAGLLQGLQKMAEDAGATIITNAQATSLVYADDRVTGVVASVDGKDTTFTANKAVLLAAGGYASNGQMVADTQDLFTGITNEVPSCEPTSNDGTAIDMAQEQGASTTDMAFVQFFSFPTAQMVTIEKMIPMCMMATKMSVNSDGVRFTDDSKRFYGGGSGADTAVACNQKNGQYFLIGDASGKDALKDDYDNYVKNGLLFEGQTIEEAAKAAGLDGATVAATVTKFNGYVDAGVDPDFGRKQLDSKVDGAPYFVVPISMYVQNTMGGLVINSDGNVVDESGKAIAGLYAAGEVTGNFDGACRRHGDNFAQILYYGYLCGKTAAE